MQYVFVPKGVCSRKIYIDIEGEVIKDVRFEGGCAGNTRGLSEMVKGLNAKDVIKKLKGITCGIKPTSCPDQLAKSLEEILAKS